MGKYSALNKHVKEANLFKRRVITAIVVVTILSLILLIRLVYLQLVQHQFFSTLSRQNLLDIIPLKPSRGLIYDRNGVVLAKNVPSYSLALIPEKNPNIPATIKQLKKIIAITDEDIKQFNHYRNRYRSFDAIPLKMKLSEEAIAQFYVNQQFFRGIVIQARSMRYYPQGNITSEIVGYVGRINPTELRTVDHNDYDSSDDIGKDGIEKYYENILHGHIGSEEAEINATGHIVRSLKETPPTAGKNIYLTIDSRLQAAAHNYLGDDTGAIVVIKPDTGEILALVSHPSFDANIFAKGINQKDYQTLLNSPNHLLYNRAIRGQYAAASTLKPFISVASLDSGVISPDSRVYDPGWFRLPNTSHTYHDWKHGGHGWVNVAKAIESSCDVFFYHLAEHLGISELHAMLQQFGFGKKTDIDLPDEKAGLIPSPAWKQAAHHAPWYTGDTIETVIGQGFFLTTPLQLAAATATLANRGTPVQPHLLLKTVAEDNTVVTQSSPQKEKLAIHSPQSWQLVINAMQHVITGRDGTAHSFGVPHQYTVAAKTGTAQVYGHSRDEERARQNLPRALRNHHLFIAFAPIDQPKIAMVVVVEHNVVANKIARELFDFYFKYAHENL